MEPSLERTYREERRIKIISESRISGVYSSVLQVHAIEINNNTEIRCRTYSGNFTSQPALLRIQGSYLANLKIALH